jgi:hypothetical protein
MKQIARAILRAIVNDLPNHKLEFGQAMLAELEETNGLQALVWASGGIQLWAHTRGGEIMKNAAFWFGLVAIGILAGGLYVTQGLVWAIPVVVIGVIAFAAFRPRDALPVALLLGLSLPIADLLRVWLTLRNVIATLGTDGISGTLQTSSHSLELFPKTTLLNTEPTFLDGSVTVFFDDTKMKAMSSVFENLQQITTNQLPQLTAAVLIGAIVFAGLAAFVRSRVTAREQV